LGAGGALAVLRLRRVFTKSSASCLCPHLGHTIGARFKS
jgi:hypothetical protein